jgi:hypothetical protein
MCGRSDEGHGQGRDPQGQFKNGTPRESERTARATDGETWDLFSLG